MDIDAGKKKKAAEGLLLKERQVLLLKECHSATRPSFPTTVLSDSYRAVHACSRCRSMSTAHAWKTGSSMNPDVHKKK